MKISNKERSVSLHFGSKLLLFVLTLASIQLNASESHSKSSSFILKVRLDSSLQSDTLLLIVSDKYFISYTENEGKTLKGVLSEDGTYTFNVLSEKPYGYWKLAKTTNRTNRRFVLLTIPFFWEKNDSISLLLNNKEALIGVNSNYIFSGTGKEKYKLRCKADTIWKEGQRQFGNPNLSGFSRPDPKMVAYVFNRIDENKSQISDIALYLIKADLLLGYSKGKGFYASDYVKKNKIPLTDFDRDQFINSAIEYFSFKEYLPLDSSMLSRSANAIIHLFLSIKVESILRFDTVNSAWVYNEIKRKYSSNLRDELIAYQFQYEKTGSNIDSIYNDAISEVNSSSLRSILARHQNRYKNWDMKNYNFLDLSGNTVNLNLFKGRVLLIDIWFNGCMACAEFYNEVLSNVEKEFSCNREINFLSISTDKKKEKWLEGIASGLYTSKEVVNLNTGPISFLHPMMKDNDIYQAPTLLLINKEGKIKFINTTNMRSIKGLKAVINESLHE